MSEMNGHAIAGSAFSREAFALASTHAQKLRDEWQCRLLAGTDETEFAVTLAMLANLYYEAMHTMLLVVFPGFKQLQLPMLTGFATIAPDGKVLCDYIDRDQVIWRQRPIYDSEDELIGAFRRIADKLKFNDRDRIAMFAALKRWVSRDMRIKPGGEP